MRRKEPNPLPDFNLIKPPPSNLPSKREIVELLLSRERFQELVKEFKEIRDWYGPEWREHGSIGGSEADSGFTQESVPKLIKIIEELINVTDYTNSPH